MVQEYLVDLLASAPGGFVADNLLISDEAAVTHFFTFFRSASGVPVSSSPSAFSSIRSPAPIE